MNAAPSLHPVRVVVERTGLTPDVIRVWERRYGAVTPARSGGRHRLYSDDDVERLRLLARLTAGGRSIGRIARLSIAELGELLAGDTDAVRTGAVSSDLSIPPAPELDDALNAIARFDTPALENALRNATIRLGADATIDAVLAPLIQEIGARWHEGTFTPANEHMATAVIRTALSWMTARAAASDAAPAIVVATPAGQIHELGALLVAATATTHGWRVTYLGANLPFDEIVHAAERVRARAIALSLVHPAADRVLEGELARGIASLPERFAVVIGGASAPSYAHAVGSRAKLVESLPDFRRWLHRAA